MTEHEHHWGSEVLDPLTPLARELRHEIPAVLKGFAELHHAAMADGALDRKTKELIALAIAISHRCDGCIASHARAAAKAGASRAEVAEAIGVSILMNGGPGTVYGPRALDAYDDFAEPTPSA
ncbi:MAG: carboxymuconolactone decarboxylase family protein [Actinomycetota bacterium]